MGKRSKELTFAEFGLLGVAIRKQVADITINIFGAASGAAGSICAS